MNIINAIKNLEKTEKNRLDYVDVEDMLYALDINESYVQTDNRMEAYYLYVWYCTDTWVGGLVYFLDGNPVAFSQQHARKSNEEFYFLSREGAFECRSYLLDLIDKSNCFEPRYINIEQEIEDEYNINFYSQYMKLFHEDKMTYNGEKVLEISKVITGDSLKDYLGETVNIKTESNYFENVNISDVKIKLNIVEE